MLVAPAIAGIICFIFGIATVWSPIFNQGRYLFNMKNYFKNNYNCFLIIHFYRSSEEICSDDIFGKLDMCPECDKYCNYWQLSNSCFLSRITYLFDNSSTVLFAIFMTGWGKCLTISRKNFFYFYLSFFYKATTFLEMWKRRQAILKWEWDLSDNEDVEETPGEKT